MDMPLDLYNAIFMPYLWFDDDTMDEGTPETDLISELPDCLLVQILSNLEILHAVQTCVLSKRWRYLWTSLPCLRFGHMSFSPIDEFGNGSRFVEFIDSVMSVRNRFSSNIHTLAINEHDDVHFVTNDGVVKWINVGLQHNLVELYINVMLDLVLPHSLFKCESLENLTVCLRGKNLSLALETPDLVDLPALNTLILDQLTFVGEDVSNLVSKCPVLETFIILRCNMIQTDNLVVIAPQLKHLKVLYLTAGGYGVSAQEVYIHKVTGFTPNLTSFECSELWMMGNYSLLYSTSPLVEAIIRLPSGPQDIFHNNGWTDLFAHNVKKCLLETLKVKDLFLNIPDRWLQAIFVPPAQGRYIHIQFLSLTRLTLRTSVVEQQTHARFYLLEMCPNLETLVLDITTYINEPDVYNGNEIFSSVDEECLQKKLPLKCTLRCIWHHLKFVEICGNALQLESELAFVRFLLQNALVLETVSLRHDVYYPTPRLLEFVNNVEVVTKSPNVKISLDGEDPDA